MSELDLDAIEAAAAANTASWIRTDVPALIAEVRRLRAEREQAVADALPTLAGEIKRLRAKNERLRRELADALRDDLTIPGSGVAIAPRELADAPWAGGATVASGFAMCPHCTGSSELHTAAEMADHLTTHHDDTEERP